MTTEDATAAELRGIADDWAAAIVANDAELISVFMAEEWVIVSETGVSTKREFLDEILSGRLTHSAMDRVGEPHILVYGDTAIVTARVTNTAHYEGRRFDADEWTTDVFRRRDDCWFCVHSHITPVRPA